jgi:hypothetical protein
MGHLRALFALAAAGLVCVALSASASAREPPPTHQFVGSVSSEITLLTSEQELDFASIVIHCKGVKAVRTHKKSAFPSLAILVRVGFIKCKTGETELGHKHLPGSKATVGGPLEIEYQAGGEPNATIVNSVAVPVTFGGGLEGCTISISTSPATDEAKYKNTEAPAKNRKVFPTGIQHLVSITNSFERIPYTIGGGPCETIKKTTKEGEYFGTLLTGLKTGDLSWE